MKIKELQKILEKKNLDFALFFNTSMNKKDFFVPYFSGLNLELVFVLIPKKGIPFVIVSNLEIGRSKKLSKIKKVIGFEKNLFELLKKKLGENKRIGINNFNVSLHESKLLKKHLGAKLVDISKEAKSLRETKTSYETKIIDKACMVTDNIFNLVTKKFNSFNTELDIKNFIDNHIRSLGHEPAFSTTINSGANASYGHYSTTNEKLKKGFCIIDFGVNVEGYCSDMTRTIFIGKPTKKELEAYKRVKNIQQECLDNIKVGMKFDELDNIARKKLGKNLIHSLGHGLGLEVHEAPSVGPNSKDKIKVGHVFTVEPGEYVSGKYGIRIEDDVIVTKKGVKVLNKSSKELIIFERN